MRNIRTIFTHFKKELYNKDPKCFLKNNKNKSLKLNKNYIIMVLRYHDKQHLSSFNNILEAIKDDPLLSHKYIETLPNGLTIIKLHDLIALFSYHDFLGGSPTSYESYIGLMGQGNHHYIKDNDTIILGFPYKDTILKGGMSKDENSVSVSEPFLNETINAPEVTELKEPKILIDAKKYDKNHLTHPATVTKFDPEKDSLFIKGNNLIALYSLRKIYRGKVKLIYLDPPFNTGTDDFGYNDHFNHSAWLVFMKNRLQVARDLLSENGLIFVNIDNNESAYLKVLMDEPDVFGRQNYINTITFKSAPISGTKTQNKNKTILSETNYIHVYAKNSDRIRSKQLIHPQYISKSGWETRKNKYLLNRNTNQPILVPLKKILVKNHIINRSTPIKSSLWHVNKFRKFIENHANAVCQTTEVSSSDLRSHVIKDNTVHKIVSNGKMYYLYNNSRIIFLRDSEHYVNGKLTIANLLGNLWSDKAVSSRTTEHEGGIKFQNAKKPERLLKRIIAMATNPGDLVMDFFAGSATTQAVAMKMKRRFIGVEQMNYPVSASDLTPIYIKRLENVIKGEQHGISKDNDIKWTGGGSFIYAKMKPLNQRYYDQLNMDRGNGPQLDKDANYIFKNANLVATADLLRAKKYYTNNLNGNNSKKKTIKKKYIYLMAVLDVNQSYYSYKNLNDSNIHVSSSDIKFNRNFYQMGGDK